MRLREWVDACGYGELARLCRETGLSYPTVLHAYQGKTMPKAPTIAKLTAATDGAVTLADFLPAAPSKRKRATTLSPKRRKRKRKLHGAARALAAAALSL